MKIAFLLFALVSAIAPAVRAQVPLWPTSDLAVRLAEDEREEEAESPERARIRAERRKEYREPAGVAVRSLVWPGWGQFALDESSGVNYSTAAVVGLVLAFELVQLSSSEHTQDVLRKMGWGIYGSSAVLSAAAAYRRAEARNRENGYDLDELSRLGPPDRTVRVALLRVRF